MLKEFKAFIMRGNVIDLAVGIVIGAAFTSVVSSFVKYLLTPLVSIPGSKLSGGFATYAFKIGGGTFAYGQFLNDLFSFLLVSAAVFFLVVKPINSLNARRLRGSEQAPGTRDCPECLSEIPAKARRCSFCTATVEPSE